MFILIPLLLILASASGIFFIVWRKLPRLEELAGLETFNGVSVEKNWHKIIYNFCPEVWDWIKNIKVDEYKEVWLIETEKLLRRLRVASLKIDRFSDTLIKKIRRSIYSNGNVTYATAEGNESTKNKSDIEIKENNREEFKRAEQKLILEIAKNPKSATLYEELGDLYAKMGDYQDAKESYEAATELNPQNEELKKTLSSISKKLQTQK